MNTNSNTIDITDSKVDKIIGIYKCNCIFIKRKDYPLIVNAGVLPVSMK